MKNKVLKKEIGITLIALIITIIILVILAGIAISGLTGENGLIAKVEKAKLETRKAEYFEEIALEITNEQIERYQAQKVEEFIASLKNRIENIKDISSVVMCDEDLTEQEVTSKNTILIITTKDGYEIIVDVDNDKLTATIREESFSKAGEEFKMTYDANTGSGNVEAQSIRKGFSATLRNNGFIKENYFFAGWSKNKKATYEAEDVYAAGSKIQIEEDTTLYAIWKQEVVTITYDANNENTSEEMEPTPVGKGNSIKISDNLFTREGYTFTGWNTKSDGNGTSYENGSTITNVNENLTLYAIWEINQYTATFYSNLIANGQFSNGTNGWETFNSASMAVDTSVKYEDQNSLRISNSKAERDGIRTTYNIAYKPHTKYRISLEAYRDSTSSYGNLTKTLMIYLPEYNSSNTLLTYHHNCSIVPNYLNDKEWKEYSWSIGSITGGAKFGRFVFDYLDISGTTNIWIADVKVEEVQERTLNYGTPLGILPTTTRTGYTSGGYYTGENGTGTQISPTTLLLTNTSYYEKWTSN